MSCTENKVIEALGDHLLGKDGKKIPTSEALAGKKVLGLYFSAHWCPPCRGFTPTLSEKYTKLKEAGKEFELVFVSGDRDKKSFTDYHKEMSFLALPFDNSEGNETLNELFEVSGIPSLVFVDVATGQKITDEGREAISKADFIEKFPYKPKPFNFFESLGNTLVTKNGTISTKDALKDKKVLGLYFSAHWCPPCRGFTPVLSQKYTQLKAAGKEFELVFVSSDRDEASFADYHKEMTFLAMPYSNRDGKAELSKAFGVSGIPSLCFVEADTGKLITDEGRGAISAPSFIEDFPYHPKPVNDLATSTSGINNKPSLILFMEDQAEDEQKVLTSYMTEVAEKEMAKEEKEQTVQCFFTATDGGPLAQIRKGTKMESQASPARPPCLLLLKLPDNGKYYKFEGKEKKVTVASIETFMKDVAGGKVEAGIFGR